MKGQTFRVRPSNWTNADLAFAITSPDKSNWSLVWVQFHPRKLFQRKKYPLLYFILGRAKLHRKFSTIIKEGSQIFSQIFTDFLPATCTGGNLRISEASLSQLESFQCSLTLLNLKYNHAVLFLKEMYWLFIYNSKYFLIDHHCKTLERIYWYPRKWQNLLNFLQGGKETVFLDIICPTTP